MPPLLCYASWTHILYPPCANMSFMSHKERAPLVSSCRRRQGHPPNPPPKQEKKHKRTNTHLHPAVHPHKHILRVPVALRSQHIVHSPQHHLRTPSRPRRHAHTFGCTEGTCTMVPYSCCQVSDFGTDQTSMARHRASQASSHHNTFVLNQLITAHASPTSAQ